MAGKRNYKIKGTKDFLVLAGIFFFLGLWAVKDAWYPSPKVLEKHPRVIAVSFDQVGSISQLHVSEGDSVSEDQPLAELSHTKLKEEFSVAKKEYSALKKKYVLMNTALDNAIKNGASDGGIESIANSRDSDKVAMNESLDRVSVLREKLDNIKLVAPSKGTVKELLVATHSFVKAGETVMVIDPQDHFYLFNKSLAIFSAIAFTVFLSIHILAH